MAMPAAAAAARAAVYSPVHRAFRAGPRTLHIDRSAYSVPGIFGAGDAVCPSRSTRGTSAPMSGPHTALALLVSSVRGFFAGPPSG
eukprot:CAMPEP_0119198858 /NCGR_PEP_ID=MMETSP1316-20130426/20721_1 /TAXON_ID=41880 /ORGANISM="Pycnococcus provasolii, Strain RCC2336" /LENGTH=85 /DNA_ID=CAMNT_0007194827 /DNA_START=254 /DNA_END=511 /DNA_ORIENTATION=-